MYAHNEPLKSEVQWFHKASNSPKSGQAEKPLTHCALDLLPRATDHYLPLLFSRFSNLELEQYSFIGAHIISISRKRLRYRLVDVNY